VKVITDVVRRYDVDGVHFDDYFYPYAEKDAAGNKIDFPDEKNWNEYLRTVPAAKRLGRDDWRRANVNRFIETVGREIKRIKPQIVYGISPFGIWQPVPEQGIAGFNAYAELFADARKWLQDGTVDYLSPQLYWETARPGLSFPVLLDWCGPGLQPTGSARRLRSTRTRSPARSASRGDLPRRAGLSSLV
jgi:uncharacterized lipoprotein YddW (UPF0748 family)